VVKCAGPKTILLHEKIRKKQVIKVGYFIKSKSKVDFLVQRRIFEPSGPLCAVWFPSPAMTVFLCFQHKGLKFTTRFIRIIRRQFFRYFFFEQIKINS
jgi:hypothetical protein